MSLNRSLEEKSERITQDEISSKALTQDKIKELIKCYFRNKSTPLFDRLPSYNEIENLIEMADSSKVLLSLYYLKSKNPIKHKKGLELLHHLSAENNANAQYILAELYAVHPYSYRPDKFCFVSNEIKQDTQKAFELFKAAAKQHHADALCRLGDGTFPNVKKKDAFDFLLNATKQHTSDSILRIAGWQTDYPPEYKAAALLAKRMLSTNKHLSETEQNQVMALLQQSVSFPKSPTYLSNEYYTYVSIVLGDIYSKKENFARWSIPQDLLQAAHWYEKSDHPEGYFKAARIVETMGLVEKAAKLYRKSTSGGYKSGNEIFLLNLYKKSRSAAVVFHTTMAFQNDFPKNVELEIPFLEQLQADFRALPIKHPGKFYEFLEEENAIKIFIFHSGVEKKLNVTDNFGLIAELIGPPGCEALANYLRDIKLLLMNYPIGLSDLIFSYITNLEDANSGEAYFYPKASTLDRPEETVLLPNRYLLFKEKEKKEEMEEKAEKEKKHKIVSCRCL